MADVALKRLKEIVAHYHEGVQITVSGVHDILDALQDAVPEWEADCKRLEEAEKNRQVLAKALTALYRHEDATADALAELAGFETWEEVYIAALAKEEK